MGLYLTYNWQRAITLPMILVGIIHKVQHNRYVYILYIYICIYILYSYFSTASYASHVYAGGWFTVRAFLCFFWPMGWGGLGWGGVG